MKIAYLFLNGELRGDTKFYLNFIKKQKYKRIQNKRARKNSRHD